MIKRLLAFVTVSGTLTGISVLTLFASMNNISNNIGTFVLMIISIGIYMLAFKLSTRNINKKERKYLMSCYINSACVLIYSSVMWKIIIEVFRFNLNIILKIFLLFIIGVCFLLGILLFLIMYFNNVSRLERKIDYIYYEPSDDGVVYIKPCYDSRELIEIGYANGYLGKDDIVIVIDGAGFGLPVYSKSYEDDSAMVCKSIESLYVKNLNEKDDDNIVGYFINMDSCIKFFKKNHNKFNINEFVVGITNKENGAVDIYKLIKQGMKFTISQIRFWDSDLQNFRYLSTERVVDTFDVRS